MHQRITMESCCAALCPAVTW